MSEITEDWAASKPDFLGTIKQFVCCAKCGEALPFKRHDEPRKVFDMLKSTMHFLCDECYETLPE